ncbi:PD40 domain-containing protein, partial [bacterium]|nr:PD40 domain-containing protein [bacterium]
PDGSKVLFCSDRNGFADIYTMNKDGSNIQQLTSLSSECWCPKYNPAGDKIVFHILDTFLSSDIYIMDADGSNVTQITNNVSYYNMYPDFSKDGTKIVYTSMTSIGSITTQNYFHTFTDEMVYTTSGEGVMNIDWRGLYKVPINNVDTDPNDSLYDWDGEAVIRCIVKDYAGNTTYFTKEFYVDTTPPIITILVDSSQYDPNDASTNPTTGWDNTTTDMQSIIHEAHVAISISSDDSRLYNCDDLRDVPALEVQQANAIIAEIMTGKLLKTVDDTNWETDYPVLTSETVPDHTWDGLATIQFEATDIAGNTINNSVDPVINGVDTFLVDTYQIQDDKITHDIEDKHIIGYSPDTINDFGVIKIKLEDTEILAGSGVSGVDEMATVAYAKVTYNGVDVEGTWDIDTQNEVTFKPDASNYYYPSGPTDPDFPVLTPARIGVLKDGDYEVIIYPTDEAGNTGEYSFTFRVDHTAPIITVELYNDAAYGEFLRTIPGHDYPVANARDSDNNVEKVYFKIISNEELSHPYKYVTVFDFTHTHSSWDTDPDASVWVEQPVSSAQEDISMNFNSEQPVQVSLTEYHYFGWYNVKNIVATEISPAQIFAYLPDHAGNIGKLNMTNANAGKFEVDISAPLFQIKTIPQKVWNEVTESNDDNVWYSVSSKAAWHGVKTMSVAAVSIQQNGIDIDNLGVEIYANERIWVPTREAKYSYSGWGTEHPSAPWIDLGLTDPNGQEAYFEGTIVIDNDGDHKFQGDGSIYITANDYAGNESTFRVDGGEPCTPTGAQWSEDGRTSHAFEKDTIPAQFPYVYNEHDTSKNTITIIDDINMDDEISAGDLIRLVIHIDTESRQLPYPPQLTVKETISGVKDVINKEPLALVNPNATDHFDLWNSLTEDERIHCWVGERIARGDDNTTMEFKVTTKDWASNTFEHHFSKTVQVIHSAEPYMKFDGVPLRSGNNYTISSWVKGESLGQPKVVIVQVKAHETSGSSADKVFGDEDFIENSEIGFIFDSATKSMHPVGNVSNFGLIPEKTQIGLTPKWYRCWATFRFNKHKENIDITIGNRNFSENDVDNNGFIDGTEITQYMRNNQFDSNGDGKVSFNEFRQNKIGNFTYLMLYNKGKAGSKAYFDAAMVERGDRPTKWTETISIHKKRLTGEVNDGAINNTKPLDQR